MTEKLAIAASVIVPSYRGAQRLPELLECLTRQDFNGKWEVIVALDGEYDNSRALLSKYEAHLPLRVIASATNRGVSATLNDAYAAARGQVLIRCDDDLSPQPHMVRRHVQRHTESDVPLGVIGGTRDVFADSPYAYAYGVPANRRGLEAVYRRSEGQSWMHWAAHNSVTRESWDLVGGFDPAFSYREDSELGYRLYQAGVRIVVDPELEIKHRGPAQNAADRIPRAYISGASRRAFEERHPETSELQSPARLSVKARVWDAGISYMAMLVRSPASARVYGRFVDALPAAVPSAVRALLIALGVEAAACAGYARVRTDQPDFRWQSARQLTESSKGSRTPIALWLVPVPDLAGVARHVLDAARVGIPGWRLVVLCPEGALAARLRAQGSAVTTAAFGPSVGIRASRASLSRIADAVRPDIVHSHLAYADIINAWTHLPRGTRRFSTEHGIAGDDSVYHDSGLSARLMATVHRLRLRRFDGVIAVSHATREAMIAKWRVRQPIEVIPNGVDLPAGVKQRTQNPKTLRVLSLSRLAPEKRVDKLIDAFELVKKQRPDATLTIAGDGELRDALVAHARRLGLDDITFAGYVDASTAMAAADMIVQLSIWENLSYTLLDAAAQEIPVVASRVGGNPEIVQPGGLVASIDAVTVAEAILAGGGSTTRPTSCAEMCEGISRLYDGSQVGAGC